MATLRARLKRIPGIYKSYQAGRFAALQLRLAWTAAGDRLARSSAQGVPLPPARLRFRVHGSLDRAAFVATGRTLAADVTRLLAVAGVRPSESDAILDFGCGCGRVLPHLVHEHPGTRFFGTDIDGQAIAWCKARMPGAQWATNGFWPPLAYADGTFASLYSISVFTHLDEPMQNAWLAELHRVLRPGGVALLTVHGSNDHDTLPPKSRAALAERGFLYTSGGTGRLKLDGLPDFYQTAFHTQEYIEREWSKLFRIVAYVPRSINAHQDAVLLRKDAR